MMKVKSSTNVWVGSREEWERLGFAEWFGEWESEWGYSPGVRVWGVDVWVHGTYGDRSEHESALMVKWPDGAGAISVGWGNLPRSGYWEEHSDLGSVLRVDLENGVPCAEVCFMEDGSEEEVER
jgi:hypothetical protein